LALGKSTQVVTLHLLKAAPKMTRLDEVSLKKRAAARGEVVVEVRPGDSVLGLTEGWLIERYLPDLFTRAQKAARETAKEEAKAQPRAKQLELLKTPPSKTAAVNKTPEPAKKSAAKVPAQPETKASRSESKPKPVAKKPAVK
jgi:hypothetical protein